MVLRGLFEPPLKDSLPHLGMKHYPHLLLYRKFSHHEQSSFAPSQYKGGDVVRIFKSLTARELFKRFPTLKKDLWGGQFWSGGYYLATVGERGNWNAVKKYVENQGKTEDTTQLKLLT